MSSEQRFEFTKENLDLYLRELAREYRKQVGKSMPAELILIGGASVLLNYGFRNMTTDVDALIRGSSAMKDAVNRVGDRYRLPNGWLNADFMRTESYTPRLAEHAVFYRTFSNVLNVYTVSAEYLIAMKLRAGRQYKSDLSDVLGILAEHEKRGTPIRMAQLKAAVADLYGDWNVLPAASQRFIDGIMENGRFSELFEQIRHGEQETKALLTAFEQAYPGVIRQSNVDAIAESLQEKADRAAVLRQLRSMRDAASDPTPQNDE